MILSRGCGLFLVLSTYASVASGGNLTVDLAAQAPGTTIERPVTAGTHDSVLVVNRAPGRLYNVRVRTVARPIDPLPISGIRSLDCQELSTATSDLESGGLIEAQVPARRAAVEKALGTCSDATLRERALAVVRATTMPVGLGAVELRRGEDLVVEVSRDEAGQALTWTVTFSTGDRGRWRTSYGFTFFPSEDEEFFTHEVEMGKFEIRAEKDREKGDFAPSVLFHWLGARWELNDWAISPVGGFGFELDKPVVLGGAALSYNQNLSLVAGLAVHPQKRLLGRYAAGDVVGEALEGAQLHEDTYGLNWFIGLAFRFDSNPFSREDDAGGE